MYILTFDIEEWFHILDNDSTKTEHEWSRYEKRLEKNVHRILDLLDRKQVKATFFCLGWVAREYPHVVRMITDLGYEVASHSDRHQLAYEQDRNEFAEDIRRSLDSIEQVTGKKVTAYRAPGFSIMEKNQWALEVLAENGVEVDCSIFPVKRAHGGFASYGHARPSWIEIKGVLIKEFPINYLSIKGFPVIFSGGGYFRIMPYEFIFRMMQSSEYVMTYFHPRDFDVRQPVIRELNMVRRFKSYYGINAAFSKLERLIDKFSFVDLQSAIDSVNWDKADIYKL
jgi:polysaccharide deacetylase family protein (PEP-CTERM system associated)